MGSTHAGLVRRVARHHRDDLCACTLGAAPDQQLRIAYVIDSHGEVTRAHVEHTDGSMAVAECIAGVIEGWQFPRGNICGVALVEQRFALRATSSDGPR